MEVNHALQVLSQKTIPELNFLPEKVSKKEAFIEHVSPFVAQLLDNDFSRLLQIMYRIDVPEKEFALTLQIDNAGKPAEKIASLIYDRLMLKAKIRAHYKNKDA